jgi:seryl-tRNA synthetase
MLPIQLFRQNKELVLEGLKKRNFKETELVDQIIAIDEKRRQIQVENDQCSIQEYRPADGTGQKRRSRNPESRGSQP